MYEEKKVKEDPKVPKIPEEFSEFKAPAEVFVNKYANARRSYGCCTYHWINAIDISTSMNLIQPHIIRWLFQYLFHQAGGCDQYFSTFGFDSGVPAYNELFVDSIAFNPFLPAANGNVNTNYGAALHNAADIILMYMNWNSCAIFISDGVGTTLPHTDMHLFLFTLDQLNNHGYCTCSVCIHVTGVPIDPIFKQMCDQMSAHMIADSNPWNAGYGLWNFASQKIYNSTCSC